jgi:Ca-activated chloride channel family protein
MTRINERKLAQLLTGPPVPEPPPELRDQLVAEIPTEISLHPDLGRETDGVVPFIRRRHWHLAAAAMLLLTLSGAVTWKLRDRMGPSETTLATLQTAAPQGAPARELPLPSEATMADEVVDAEAFPDSDARTADRQTAIATLHHEAKDDRPDAAIGRRAAATNADSDVAGATGNFKLEVTDDTGSPLPGVTIQMVAARPDAAAHTTVTDRRGEAVVGRLPVGEYDVQTGLEGFVQLELQGVTVEAADTASAQVALRPRFIPAEVGSADELKVTAESPVIDVGRVSTGRVFGQAELRRDAKDSRSKIAPAPAPPTSDAEGWSDTAVVGAVAAEPQGRAESPREADAAPARGRLQSKTAAAPVSYGAITGVVTGPDGSPLPGVTVIVSRTGAGFSKTTISDGNGGYLIQLLPSGRYDLAASLSGFETVTRTVDIEAGDRQRADVVMTPIVGAAELEVVSEMPLVDTPSHQLPIGRGYQEFLRSAENKRDYRAALVGEGGKVHGSTSGDNAYYISDVSTSPPPPSTGGTAEPNDAPYGDMFFHDYGVNPFVDTDDDALSTFALEVDTGSATIVRRYLSDGHLPPHDAVRVEELVNYYAPTDPPPRRGDVRLSIEAGPSPWTENGAYRVIRFGLRFRDVDQAARPPATLIFVVDTSGSMAREDRLGLVQRALASLLANLRDDDRVGVVEYGSRGRVLLEPTADKAAVRHAIDRLVASGSTNADEGLQLGYRLADEYFVADGINRLILCSDGVANVGRTGPESILEHIGDEARRGIELTTVGVGMGNTNDVLMEQLADRGNGRYAYVDSFKEARRLFVEELTGTLLTVAHDAKVQVEFDPKLVSRWRLLGYENRAVADDRFRDPTVDAGEIGAGHMATAVYEIKLARVDQGLWNLATLHLRYRPTGSDAEVEVQRRLRGRDLAPSWERSPSSLRLAATVAEFAELLKGTYWARDGSMDRVADELERLEAELDDDPRVVDVAALARRAAALMADQPRRETPGERD